MSGHCNLRLQSGHCLLCKKWLIFPSNLFAASSANSTYVWTQGIRQKWNFISGFLQLTDSLLTI